jgi:hypothetical protein
LLDIQTKDHITMFQKGARLVPNELWVRNSTLYNA